MVPVSRLFTRLDTWVRDLSRPRYAFLLGASAATGVLVVGLLLSRETLLVQAVTMGFVMFALEYALGTHQTTDG